MSGRQTSIQAFPSSVSVSLTESGHATGIELAMTSMTAPSTQIDYPYDGIDSADDNASDHDSENESEATCNTAAAEGDLGNLKS